MKPAPPGRDRPRLPRAAAALMNLKWFATALVVVGTGAVALSILLGSPRWSALGIFLAGTGLACFEFGRLGFQGMNPLAVAMMMLAAGGLADLAALLLENSDLHDDFFLYASPPHIPAALLVVYAGLVSLWAGYQLASRQNRWQLPSVWCDAGSRVFVPLFVLVYALRLLAGFVIPIGSLGTPGALFLMAGPIGAFMLTKRGAETGDRTMSWTGVAIAAVDAARAAMFEILRMNIVLPLGAAALGLTMGTRATRALRRIELLPVYALFIVGLPYFGTFGETRDTLGYGMERLTEIQTLINEDDPGFVSIVSRLTTINQVSQVVRLAEETGFRRGETLEYLGWVWIPRFVWPGKPQIAKGQWFAAEIGRGFFLPSGAFSNSINMTIPGELYLNLSWPGIVVGCLLIGALLSLLWQTAEVWRPGSNPWGSALGFFLLYCGAVFIVDLQMVVTMMAAYLVFLAAAAWTRATQARKERVLTAPIRRC